jgi:hypothetical protein
LFHLWWAFHGFPVWQSRAWLIWARIHHIVIINYSYKPTIINALHEAFLSDPGMAPNRVGTVESEITWKKRSHPQRSDLERMGPPVVM